MFKGKIMLTIFIALTLITGSRFYILGKQSSNLEVKVGVIDGKLTACPKKPNCLSSFEKDKQRVSPIKSTLTLKQIKSVISSMEGAKLIKEERAYLYFTFTSSTFSFVDDLELLSIGNLIHIKSASRTGHYDLGANKKRIETIRKLLQNHR